MTKKKWLSVLLAVVLVAALLPTMAFAADYTEWTDNESLPTSGTYKLMTDINITIDSYNGVSIGRNSLVLDLNGHTVNFTSSRGNAITLSTGGSLTIEDNSDEQDGKITNANGYSAAYSLIYANGGSVTLKGGTLEGYGAQVLYANTSNASVELLGGAIVNNNSNGGYGLYVNNAQATISNTTITNNQRSGYALFANSNAHVEILSGSIINNAASGYAIQVNGNAVVEMTDGLIHNTVTGADTVYVNGGEEGASFIMNGGTVQQDCTYSSSAAIDANNGAKAVTINGGTVKSNSKGVYAAFTPVTVTGGTIEAVTYALQTRNATVEPAEGQTVTVNAGTAVLYTFSDSDNKIIGGDFDSPEILEEYTPSESAPATITGGSFTTSPEEYVPADSAIASFKSADEETPSSYVVGAGNISAKAAESATGDTINVISGDVELDIAVDGVVVSNEGDGNVTVNEEKVTSDNPITTHTHTFGMPVWTWAEDGSSATATFTCTACDEEPAVTEILTDNEPASEVTGAPSCGDWGETTYTATVTLNGQPYTNTKVIYDIEPTGEHDFIDGVCGVCGEPDPDYEAPKAPVITAGENGTWNIGGENGLSFTSNAEFADFIAVYVDDEKLSEDDYDVKEGSTIVTLKPAYLETLAVGRHTLEIESTTGTATTNFTITKVADTGDTTDDTTKPGDSDEPKTGDNANFFLWVSLIVVSMVGACATVIYTKQGKHSKR